MSWSGIQDHLRSGTLALPLVEILDRQPSACSATRDRTHLELHDPLQSGHPALPLNRKRQSTHPPGIICGNHQPALGWLLNFFALSSFRTLEGEYCC